MSIAARPVCPNCLEYHMGWEPHGITTIPEGVWEWPPGKWYRDKMKEKPVSAIEAAYLKSLGVKVGVSETKLPPKALPAVTPPVTLVTSPVTLPVTPTSVTKPSPVTLPVTPKREATRRRVERWRAKRRNGSG